MSSSIGPIREIQAVTPAKAVDPATSQGGSAAGGWPARQLAQAAGEAAPPAAAAPERDLLLPTTSFTALLADEGRKVQAPIGQPGPAANPAREGAMQAAARLVAGLGGDLGGTLGADPGQRAASLVLRPGDDGTPALPGLTAAGASLAAAGLPAATAPSPAATSAQMAALLQAHHPQALGLAMTAREADRRQDVRRRMQGWLTEAMQAAEADGGPRPDGRMAGRTAPLPEETAAANAAARPVVDVIAPAILPLILADPDEDPAAADIPQDGNAQDPTWTVVVEFAMLGRVAIEIVCRGMRADMLLLTDERLEPETVAFVHEMLATASALGALTTSLRMANVPDDEA